MNEEQGKVAKCKSGLLGRSERWWDVKSYISDWNWINFRPNGLKAARTGCHRSRNSSSFASSALSHRRSAPNRMNRQISYFGCDSFAFVCIALAIVAAVKDDAKFNSQLHLLLLAALWRASKKLLQTFPSFRCPSADGTQTTRWTPVAGVTQPTN